MLFGVFRSRGEKKLWVINTAHLQNLEFDRLQRRSSDVRGRFSKRCGKRLMRTFEEFFAIVLKVAVIGEQLHSDDD